MPIFIIICLAICLMLQYDSSLPDYLVAPLLIYISLFVGIISFFCIMIKKLSFINWYDVFSSSVLLVWIAYWKPFFKDDSPIFFYYPLYFAIMTAFISLFFIGQRDKIDKQSFYFMHSLSKKKLIHPSVLMFFVLISLDLQQQFMLYPTMMTLLIMRFALAGCIEGRKVI